MLRFGYERQGVISNPGEGHVTRRFSLTGEVSVYLYCRRQAASHEMVNQTQMRCWQTCSQRRAR